MPIYGDWIQASDYEETNSHLVTPTAIGTQFQEWIVSPSVPHHEPTPSELQDMIEAASTWPPVQEADEYTMGAFGAKIDAEIFYWQQLTGPLDTHLKHTEVGVTHQWAFFAASPYTEGALMWAPSLLGTPPGAIGWQWQSDLAEGGARPSQWLAASSTVQSTGAAHEQHGNMIDPTPFAANFRTKLIALSDLQFTSDAEDPLNNPAAFFDYIADGLPEESALAGDEVAAVSGADPADYGAGQDPVPFDLTPHLDAEGRVGLVGVPDWGAFLPALPTYEASDDVVRWSQHYHLTPGLITWTFRPPVFRWIYDISTPPPPLRRRQRDDGALSAPRRNSGRSSQQRSLRNRGYL